MNVTGRIAMVSCILTLGVASAARAEFASIYVFGDSLSDNGNVFALTGDLFPPSPYAEHFSNGPVAVDRLAADLGVSLSPSTAGGTNYAVGGATTGAANSVAESNAALKPVLDSTGIGNQVASFTGAPPAFNPASSLFVVWGGPNDFFLSPTAATATQAVTNLAGEIAALAGVGARHFLVPNMADLSITPYGLSLTDPERDGLQQLSLGFDAGLAQALAGLSANLGGGGVNIVPFDTRSVLDTVVANPAGYGFANVTQPCFDGLTVCADPDLYLFWDTVHPTLRGHQILGDAFAAAVPEPSTLSLLTLGLMLLIVAGRRAVSGRSRD